MAMINIDTDAIFMQVMQSPKVQAKVQEKAAKIAARARRDLIRAGIDATVTSTLHATTNGRASYDVTGTTRDPQDARRAGRITRRAGRSVR